MIPLFKPYIANQLPCLIEILHSGQLAYGKYSHEFEERIKAYIGIDNFLCTNSFNTAFLIMLNALGLQSGDEVIASPMCCLASTQPLATLGLKVVWADIDPFTGTLDPSDVKKKITSKTKAIIHNHFCGFVGHVKEIKHIAEKYGLLLIDDVSEAFGSEFEGKKAGNWDSDATVYSFQTVRLPNSIDGGGISFKSSEHFQKAIILRDYGINRAIFRDDIGEISKECDITVSAYGALPNDPNCYIGLTALKAIENLLKQQSDNAKSWTSRTSLFNILPLKIVPNSKPNYWIYGGLVENKRDFILHMRNNEGFYASSVHLPNNNYSLFGYKKALIGVEEFYSKFVALPCGWWLTQEDIYGRTEGI